MGRAFWLGELAVIACLLLGLAWPPMFVAAGVTQGVVVIRAVVRAMRTLDALESAAESSPPND